MMQCCCNASPRARSVNTHSGNQHEARDWTEERTRWLVVIQGSLTTSDKERLFLDISVSRFAAIPGHNLYLQFDVYQVSIL